MVISHQKFCVIRKWRLSSNVAIWRKYETEQALALYRAMTSRRVWDRWMLDTQRWQAYHYAKSQWQERSLYRGLRRWFHFLRAEGEKRRIEVMQKRKTLAMYLLQWSRGIEFERQLRHNRTRAIYVYRHKATEKALGQWLGSSRAQRQWALTLYQKQMTTLSAYVKHWRLQSIAEVQYATLARRADGFWGAHQCQRALCMWVRQTAVRRISQLRMWRREEQHLRAAYEVMRAAPWKAAAALQVRRKALWHWAHTATKSGWRSMLHDLTQHRLTTWVLRVADRKRLYDAFHLVRREMKNERLVDRMLKIRLTESVYSAVRTWRREADRLARQRHSLHLGQQLWPVVLLMGGLRVADAGCARARGIAPA